MMNWDRYGGIYQGGTVPYMGQHYVVESIHSQSPDVLRDDDLVFRLRNGRDVMDVQGGELTDQIYVRSMGI